MISRLGLVLTFVFLGVMLVSTVALAVQPRYARQARLPGAGARRSRGEGSANRCFHHATVTVEHRLYNRPGNRAPCARSQAALAALTFCHCRTSVCCLGLFSDTIVGVPGRSLYPSLSDKIYRNTICRKVPICSLRRFHNVMTGFVEENPRGSAGTSGGPIMSFHQYQADDVRPAKVRYKRT